MKRRARPSCWPVSLFLCVIVFSMLSCSSGDDGPDERTPFLGVYEVNAYNPSTNDLTGTYDITISNGSGKNLSISNFSPFKVPINATVSGMNMTIPLQSFDQSGLTLSVTGSGVLDDDVLTYDYDIDGFTSYSVHCVATRK